MNVSDFTVGRRVRLQDATCLSSGGTEDGKGLLRHNQAPQSANREMQQRSGSSCTIVREVMEHDNLKLAVTKAGVCTSHIIAVNYISTSIL